ncbi:DNA repair-scaffolding protein [Esox lucius]|uniref:DNA repair-scaffolding protein n=1 Tax=Esox lucius TaxID=8010 RepID=UPI0014776C80|nr:DNA repair-scaffolding protein [Esox lucius]
MTFHRKRKRYSKDIKCIFFPDDDVKVGVRREPSVTVANSATKSWERCGDSFLDTPVMKNLRSGKKWQAVRQHAQSPAQVMSSGPQWDEDPVHIAWSSSDSELSDSEAHATHLPPPLSSRAVAQEPGRPRRPAAPIQACSGARRVLNAEWDAPDELLTIDPESDVAEPGCEGEEENISDCDSVSYSEEPQESSPKLTTVPEISEYQSENEVESHDTLARSSLQAGEREGSRRSVSDWVRSAQAGLQTPRKQGARNPKTPEDSAKKKRTFQSGGLAERLNRLQCRQRSAISFWRHQSISDINGTTTVEKPGVLVLEVLSVREESSMLLALCDQHQTPATDQHTPLSNTSTTTTSGAVQHNPSTTDCSPHLSTTSRARVLVLFSKETASRLTPTPRDIIHVYPPWQRLMMEGQHNIILNTHFSQKVYSDTKPASQGPMPIEKCNPYSLVRIFGQLEIHKSLPVVEGMVQQVSAPQSLCCVGRPVGRSSGRCDSLLEAMEGLGQAGWVGQGVEVVVQRVYCTPVRERSIHALLKSRPPGGSPTAPPVQKCKNSLCALVQDSYGMFSVVQLRPLPSEDLPHYTSKWEGRTCVLRAIKVVQRVTRERCTTLFNLIDSLWPPLEPLKVLGAKEGGRNDSRTKGPAPSFCYLLSGHENSVEPIEGQPISPLYLPPTEQTLRDITLCELSGRRCSFLATVLHKRIQSQSGDVGQSPGEVWLMVTDPSLQEEPQPEGPLWRRTQAVCLTTSCVLTSSVAMAISNPTLGACLLSFRDAVREHGNVASLSSCVVVKHPKSLEQCTINLTPWQISER